MDAPDLFTASVEERIASRAPLAARMRPMTLDDVVGQEHLVGPTGPLRRLIESDRLASIILWGSSWYREDNTRGTRCQHNKKKL